MMLAKAGGPASFPGESRQRRHKIGERPRDIEDESGNESRPASSAAVGSAPKHEAPLRLDRTVVNPGAVLLLPGMEVPIDVDGKARSRPVRKAAVRRGELLRPTKISHAKGVQFALLKAEPQQPGVQFALPIFVFPVWFRYRTIEFSLPATWADTYESDLEALYADYDAAEDGWAQMSHGLVGSTNGTIDELWSRIQRTPTDFATAFDLIGCYNLHRGDSEVASRYRFWRFSWGAPLQVHLWTHQLLLTFSSWFTPGSWRSTVESRVTECDGMPAFVISLLQGSRAEGRENWTGEACYLTVSYRSDGTDAHEVTAPCLSDYTCEQQYKPTGSSACDGLPWDAWTLDWQSSEHCFTSDGTTTGDCKRPDTEDPPSNCEQNAHHNVFSINLHASELAYQGAVCDYVMYLARMALDYSRALSSSGAPAATVAEYRDAADKLSRYALVVLAYNGRHWLHEIGHAWLGTSEGTYDTDDRLWSGAHCQFNCCNDVVADNWWCKVRGWLGLPLYNYESYGSDDYDPTASTVDGDESDACSDDEYAVRIWSCDVVALGVPAQQAYFCSTGCYVHFPGWFGTDVWIVPDMSAVAYTDATVGTACP